MTQNPSNQSKITLPILKVEGLNIYQGKYLAIRDVSFELFPGTDTAIVGPNGAGKSTLVKGILDLIPHTGGRIEIFGLPLSRLGNLRQLLGYVPQNFIFDRSFPISTSELVGLGIGQYESVGGRNSSSVNSWLCKFRQIRRQESTAIKVALQRTNSYHLRNKTIGTLSGGELKRVLLAYCLVTPRKLLILDEAFAGVDIQGAADFYALLNQLKLEEQWTVLQVSHDIDMVNRHCDRVLCLNQTLVCSGKPEIALSPQNLLATYGPGFSRYQHHH
ncbi:MULTISPECIES: metal ABC transporter ATP-binding protein [Cylindrospermopsis]|uniref:Metal ABC transporter ATP-binding protein n=2 Tax=Cylindrospermopsis TaxID=77021 RepID=A0A7H0F179_9CYAN|nr:MULTISPECIES: metal ABC transporter ATP-binding protein [Cylindrospermopsis]MBA4445719.1 metal ABC transporter ATP-binding protein [Cylindrospermopsis raciborskii CS-506_C]MBA4449955.1 metal ABC transporter ATP-binding protein [Cylindrospermopsis raciborskii CS-506_D]MBA4456565.1 metal ABC transporter ATP-binding protein [Cylindrospermopsis raciborskii CS-506_B]MBA4465923.1 metal ABC transporter ATP-binding protein [Cylindrospermopsis raciborskii CS-506_A]QNP29795.1 metal ABC transporter AT